MVTVNNFTNGLLNPGLAYVTSCLGAFLGLRCVTRARAYDGKGRASWLVLAAVSVGGTGIWAMHFIAMLGFSVDGQQMNYNLFKTIGSLLLAIVVVGVGLFIIGYGDAGWDRIITGGTIVGFGVAAMHYLGMDGMDMSASIRYKMPLVAASVAIAVVAGTAALWAGVRLRSVRATIGAVLIMGVAVTGMHYTGMAALEVSPGWSMTMSDGTPGPTIVVPMVVGLILLTSGIVMALSLTRTEEEIAEDRLIKRNAARIQARMSSRLPADPRRTPAGRPAVTGRAAAGGRLPAGRPRGQGGRGPAARGRQW